MNEWKPINSAPNQINVMTKIDDGNGVRNEQPLRRDGRMWWFTDGSMYVYYQPTHWREMSAADFQRWPNG